MKIQYTRGRKPPGSLPRAYAHLGAAHSFLFQLTGLEPETDAVLLDHAYAKPWNVHPDASMAKSMVTLFMTLRLRSSQTTSLTAQMADHCSKTKSDELLDVESVETPAPPPYDVSKGRTMMKECESGLAYLRDKEINDDDWEEKVNKSGWTSSQSRLFNKVVRELTADRLARLTIAGSDNEPVQLRLLVDKTAKRFRQILATVQWDRKICGWLHKIILDYIPTSFLVTYLDILQALKNKIPTLIDRLLCGAPLPSNEAKSTPKSPPPTPKSPPHTSPKSPPPCHAQPTGVVDPESLTTLLKRPWDPLGGMFVLHRLRKIPANPIILMAPDAPSSPIVNTKRKKFWHNQLSSLGKVIPISMHSTGINSGMAAQQSLENMINAMRAKVCDLREHYAPQERPIVLMGWGVGALVCMHVALVEAVSAVICLGFPFLGISGGRGDVEDPFLDLRTPTLFVLGQHAPLSPLGEIEDLREKIKAETSLVLVGGADDQLRMCRRKKKIEGITQTIVDRCIQDEILDFLLGVFAASSLHESHHVGSSKNQNNHNSGNNNSANNSRVGSKNHKVLPPSGQATTPAASKPRKRPKPNNQAVSRVSSSGDARREAPSNLKSVVDVHLGASKSAPEIPSTPSDTALHWKGSAESTMASMTTTTTKAEGTSLVGLATPAASPAPWTNAASTTTDVGIFGGKIAAGQSKASNGSRGKTKAKKQGGNPKKIPRLSNTTVDSLNVGEASKVYGLSSSQGNSFSSLRHPVSSNISAMNPVLPSQYVSGISNMGTPRNPISGPNGLNPNNQKTARELNHSSKTNNLTLQQQKLMGTLLAASSNYNSQISLAGGAFPSLISPALAAAAASASGIPQSIQQHLLAVSSGKPGSSSSSSSIFNQHQLSRGFLPNTPSTSPLSASSLQSASSVLAPTETIVTRPKLPPTGFLNAGTSGRMVNHSVRQAVSVKRPTILQQRFLIDQMSPDSNSSNEQELEDLRRKVKASTRSSESLPSPPQFTQTTPSPSTSSKSGPSPIPQSSHELKSSASTLYGVVSPCQTNVASIKFNPGKDHLNHQLQRKSVITSTLKLGASSSSVGSMNSKASASDIKTSRS